MGFLKRLCCEHEYKFYFKEKDYPMWRTMPDFCFYFVCPKCGKQICIRDSEIKSVYEEFQRQAALEQVLAPKEVLTDRFSIPYAVYGGKVLLDLSGHAAYLTRQHYLKIGIDIAQLED